MIHLDAVSMQHGSQILFINASTAIFKGEKVGLVGPNGAGKSTIFRLIMREESCDEGQVSVDKGVTLGYFDQDVGEMSGRTVVAETMAGAGEVSEVADELKKLENALSDPAQADDMDNLLQRFGDVQARFDELDGYGLEARTREILAGLGFTQEMMDGDVGKLSGGWKMRVALGRILLMRPDGLLLDEPSNHLDIESLIWLEDFLKGYEGALLMTSHDREFLNRIVGRIVEIDGGTLTSFSGNYDYYEEQRALNVVQAEAAFQRQQAMLAKEKRFIDRFKAQAAKASQVQSRIKKLDKIDELQPPPRRKVQTFEFPPVERSGDDVVRIQKMNKGFGNRVVHKDLNLTVKRGERWAIMGVNGAGKSTLLKMIAGESQPDAGECKVGASVKMGYFAQHAMEVLQGDKTIFQTLEEEFPLASIGSLRTLAGCFGFSGDDIEKTCRVLSGGEKARLVMAKLLYARPNFLVLDEPTNHLDMGTKDMLMRALADFSGTMIFVSHDRKFLAALSNRILELAPGAALPYPAGYTEYVQSSGHEAPGLR